MKVKTADTVFDVFLGRAMSCPNRNEMSLSGHTGSVARSLLIGGMARASPATTERKKIVCAVKTHFETIATGWTARPIEGFCT